MIRTVAIALLASLLFAGIAVAENALVVPSQITVASERVMLGDLVGGNDDAKLSQRFLCKAPGPGEVVALTGDFVRTRFKQAGMRDISVPDTVEILRSSMMVPATRIRNEIIGKLKHAAAGHNIEIEFRSGLRDVSVPKGRVELQVEVKKALPSRGRMMVPVTVLVNGERVDNLYVDVEIVASVMVFVAKQNLARGKVLGKHHVEQKSVPLTEVRGAPCKSIDEIIGSRTSRSIQYGRIITRGVIEAAPLVKKGDVVTITVDSGLLQVRAFGIAQKDGADGAVIPVVNVDSQQKIFATVVDANTVTVALP